MHNLSALCVGWFCWPVKLNWPKPKTLNPKNCVTGSTVAKADRSTNLRNEPMSMIGTYVVIHTQMMQIVFN